MKNITIKDIARETGFSIATVSYVLNGKKNVLEETKQKVIKSAQKLGYVKNYSAKSLVTNRSNLIGVVIPQTEPGYAMVFQNPFYSEILSSIEWQCRKLGYHIIVSGVNIDEKYYNLASERNLDAIIIIGAYSNHFYKELSNLNIPIVLVDSYFHTNKYLSVKIDDTLSSYNAVKYLIDNGHKNIAFASGSFNSEGVIQKRYLGYAKALEEANITLDKNKIFSLNTDFQSGMLIAEKIAKHNDITAVFCVADILAIGAIKQFNNMNINVPDDISVIGFDNLEIGKYITPTLTTVAQDVFQKGEKAVELVMKSLNNSKDNGNIILPTKIVVRESVKSI